MESKEYIRAWQERVGETTAHLKFDDTYLNRENLYAEYEKAAFRDDFTGLSILDIGCGGGLFAEWLYKKYDILYYLGVDISERSIEAANKRLQNISNVDLRLINPDSALKLRSVGGCIFCLSVIQHIPDKEYLDMFLSGLNKSEAEKLYLQIRSGEKTEFREDPYKTTHDIALACITNSAYVNKKLTKYKLDRKSEIAENGYQYLRFTLK